MRDAERPCPFQERPEDVRRGPRIVESTVRRRMWCPEVCGKRGELQLRTSERTRRRLSPSVSTERFSRRPYPSRSAAAFRNERSKRTLWPTITASPMNSRNAGAPLRWSAPR